MAASPSSISFLVVTRIVDQTILAERLHKATTEAEKKALHASLSLLLQRATTLKYPGWRDQRQCAGAFDGHVFALADSQGLNAVAVGVRGGMYPYPPRVAWELLQKLLDAVNHQELNTAEAKAGMLALPLKKPMQELMKSYSEPGEQDAVTQVQQKVEGVQDLMHGNIKKIIETHTTVSALQDTSAEINKSAVKFVQQSINLKRQMRIRHMKVVAAVMVTAAAFSALVLYSVFKG